MLTSLVGVVVGVLLPPGGLTPLAVVLWFGILLAPFGAVARYALAPGRRTARPRPAASAPPAPALPELPEARATMSAPPAPALPELSEARPAASAPPAPAPKRRRLTPEERAQREAERIERKAERERKRVERVALAEQRAEQRKQQQAERERKRAEKAERAAQRTTRRTATTRAFGVDPNRVYEFRYRVIDLDQLITSNTDTGAINPAYDQALQPRQRDRAASQRQIEQVARSLVPESLLWDFRQLDKGAPIVGADLMVESGNGRVLALRRARADFPQQFAAYQDKLRGQLAEMGLDASELDGKSAPVLVRERLTDVDRAAFAREANAPPVLQMSTLETARVDARRISDPMVFGLTVREEQSIDQALRAKSNAGFVRSFLGTLEETESAALLRRNGTLNQAGIWRVKAALFTRVFKGEAGERIADTFLEALDSTTKNFETALSTALPVLARAESLIDSGQRAESLRMTEDISKAVDMLARLREAEIPVTIYREQSSFLDKELTPFQEELLSYFDEIGRSPKQIRTFFNAYAAAVEDAPDPNQIDLFGEPLRTTKEELFTRITGRKMAA